MSICTYEDENMCKVTKFKVLDIRSGYSHNLCRKSSFLASHERLSNLNRKTLQIFSPRKSSSCEVKTAIKCIILAVTINISMESGILFVDNRSLPTFN